MTLVELEAVLNYLPPRATATRKALERLPAVHDAVCVVRCKDCRYYVKNKKKDGFLGYCLCHSCGRSEPQYVVENDYCSDGKRKV